MKNYVIKALTLVAILCADLAYSQERGDIGIVISTADNSQLALEYRTAQKGQYNWRIGFATGREYDSEWGYSPYRIISASDSLIVYDHQRNSSTFQTLRIGHERQFKSSIFSVFTDLTLGYQSKIFYKHNSPYVLTDKGWNFGSFSESDTVGDVNLLPGQDFGYYHPIVAGYSNYQSYRQHFLVAGMRVGLNMDLPIKKAFIIHTGVACHFSTPFYMGTTKIHDLSGNLVIYTPPSIFNFKMNAEIGIRYVFGGFKNRTRNVKD